MLIKKGLHYRTVDRTFIRHSLVRGSLYYDTLAIAPGLRSRGI